MTSTRTTLRLLAVAASDPSRATFVTNLLNALDSLAYDGIDFDWEDAVNLSELVELAKDLRSKRPGIVLSYFARATAPRPAL